MNIYNIEIFGRDWSYKSSSQVSDVAYEYDYLSLSKNKIKLQRVKAGRGDFIRITKGKSAILGIITGISDSDTMTIEYKNILSIFDVNIYADVLSVINNKEQSLEQWISETIQAYFIKNADSLQNIEGMIIEVTSHTKGKKNLEYDKNIFNLYELLTKCLTKHEIVVDTDIDFKNKAIKVVIGKRDSKERHIESDLPNVLDKEFSIDDGKESFNKIEVINEDMQSEKICYYRLQDGRVSDVSVEDDRLLPVIFDTIFISVGKDEKFDEKSYHEALTVLVPEEYDNYICITINNNDSLVNPAEWRIGQKAAILHNGYTYHTILTGVEVGKRTKLIFGAVRKELTKKLRREEREKNKNK